MVVVTVLLILLACRVLFAVNLNCKNAFASQAELFESFAKNPNFDGSVPIPIGLSFKITVPSTPGSWQVTSHSIEALGKYRGLIRKLKAFSNADAPAKEREVGALMVEYLDGTTRVIQFTSNHVGLVAGADFQKALDRSGALSNTASIKSVTHLHTHPDMENLRRSFAAGT